MRVSFNEIETTLRKAAIGTGFPVGLAEDCGCGASWLATRGHDGLHAVLLAIRDGMQKPNLPSADGHARIFTDACIAVCGPSAIDFLVGEPSCEEILLRNADSPLLMIGLAGVAAGNYCLEFTLVLGERSSVLITADKLNLTGAVPPAGANLSLACRGKSRVRTRTQTQMQSAIVDDGLWKEAQALAARTYVPSSESSRATGAGAGLTDND